MITISKVKVNDVKTIQGMLQENHAIEVIKENFLVIYENDTILGFGGYEILDNIARLNVVHIIEKNMEVILKDGLIKALLNLADLNGIKICLAKKNNDEKLYENIGFKKMEEKNFILNLDINENDYLYINTKEFFDNSCTCTCKGN